MVSSDTEKWHTAEYMAIMCIILQQINTQESMGMCHKN